MGKEIVVWPPTRRSPVTLRDSIQAFHLRVSQEVTRSGNVTATSRRNEVSRTVFYCWRTRLVRWWAR